MTFTPLGGAWRRSHVETYLRCGRQLWLEHVVQERPNYNEANFASPIGVAVHATIAAILRDANSRITTTRDTIEDLLQIAFSGALEEAHQQGAVYDPDGVDRALERLAGEEADRLERFAGDGRIQSIRWLAIETKWDSKDRWGRAYSGTLDAGGEVLETIPDFGQDGREPVHLDAGERLLVDWKNGQDLDLSFAARRANLQLGYYGRALANYPLLAGARTFIGALRDLDRPKAPSDEQGNRIPKELPQQINPKWAAAAGLSLEEAAQVKGRPKGIPKGVLKWLPAQPNPAYEAACERNKGPLFHLCEVDASVVQTTVAAAIQGAERGLFPANGPLTGECSRCSFRSVCSKGAS